MDTNQGVIVQAFRQCGASVQPLHTVGHGCPDLAIGFRGRTVLVEIKDGSLAPSRRGLTADEKRWFSAWAGEAYVVESVEQALDLIATLSRQQSSKGGGSDRRSMRANSLPEERVTS